MKLSELTEKRLEEIFLLYKKIVGGRIREYALSESSEPMVIRLEYIHNKLISGNNAEWRFGSSLNGGEHDARLDVWYVNSIYDEITRERIDKVIRFAFDPNLISGPEAEKMRKDFEKAVDELLIKWKVNVEL